MHRLMVTSIAVVLLSGLFAIPSAQAMTAPIPAGLAAVVQETSPIEDVALVCRRVQVCGPNGCGWRRQCRETGGGYGYGGGYGGGYGYGGGGGRYRTWNGCPPNWTVQDGVCKPYRGY